MNEMPAFDQFLDSELRRLLDPVTKTPAPPFKTGRKVAALTASIELAVVEVGMEPAVVPVPAEPVGA